MTREGRAKARGEKSADFVFKLECRPSLKNFAERWNEEKYLRGKKDLIDVNKIMRVIYFLYACFVFATGARFIEFNSPDSRDPGWKSTSGNNITLARSSPGLTVVTSCGKLRFKVIGSTTSIGVGTDITGAGLVTLGAAVTRMMF